MPKLQFRKDPMVLNRLSEAQQAIDDYSASHPQQFSDDEHQEFRKLLSKRAAALSEATGMKIHSLFDED